MADRKIVEEWLKEAEDDFLFAVTNLEEGVNFFSKICFHFQQAAEKYLKTYIVACDLKFLQIHDLIELLKICKAHDLSFFEIQEDCVLLNRYYIETRYPVHWPTHHTRDAAEQAREAAQRIADFVRIKLPKTV